MRISFFKTPRPGQFEYKPRHYDPDKEKREKRKKELGLSSNDNSLDRKEELHRKWRRNSMDNKQHRAGVNIWIFLFIAVLLTIFVFVIL